MATEVPVSRPPEPELSLCLLENQLHFQVARLASVGAASLLINFGLALALAGLASVEGAPPRITQIAVDTRKSTPLVFPRELTQNEPNRAEVSKQVRLDDLVPAPPVPARRRTFTPPPAPAAAQPRQTTATPAIDPPAIVAQANPPALGVNPNLAPPPAPPPQIQPQEKPPKLAFENPGSPGAQPAQRPGGLGRIAPPKPSVDEAIRGAARSGPGGLVVGDIPDDTGIGAMLGQTPSPGRQASQVELLSDPQGVDFKPYLIRVHAAVRRNWFAVIPESARFGRRGRVVIQFSVNRAGSVPKLVIAVPSGTDALDRAAVAGISASNPFPPLPSEFKGDQIRLQLVFSYNVPSR
jgi:TonB family protein